MAVAFLVPYVLADRIGLQRDVYYGVYAASVSVWSIPTLTTLNPIGAPIAHIGLQVSALFHNYNSNLFLPPHH